MPMEYEKCIIHTTGVLYVYTFATNRFFPSYMHCCYNRDKVKQGNCAICECGGKFILFLFRLTICN